MAGTKAKANPLKLVILAFAGTEARMEAMWRRHVKESFRIITVEKGYSLLGVLADIIADSSIAKGFVLVQANCFPVKDISGTQLRLPVVYQRADGEAVYDSRVPVCLDKAVLSGLLSEVKDPAAFDAEAFMRKAVSGNGFAMAVGHSFGNYIGQVLKPAPCMHRVLELFVTRLFIAANRTGWDAITGIVDEMIAK